MNRCLLSAPPRRPVPGALSGVLSRVLSGVLLGTLGVFAALPAMAQVAAARNFPPQALRATLVVTTPPEITLDGRADRLSPGARIRKPDNTLVLPAHIAGQPVVVNFTREPNGLVHNVWILTEAEAREPRAAHTPARNFKAESELDQRPRDDGKTPFNQLPRYKQ